MRKARSATNSLGGCQARTVGTGSAADNKKGNKCIDNRFPEGVPLPFEDRASSRPDSPGPRHPAATVTSAPRSLPRGALHVGCRLQHPLRPRGAPESRHAPPFPRGPWRVPGLIEPRRPSHRRRRTAWRPPSGTQEDLASVGMDQPPAHMATNSAFWRPHSTLSTARTCHANRAWSTANRIRRSTPVRGLRSTLGIAIGPDPGCSAGVWRAEFAVLQAPWGLTRGGRVSWPGGRSLVQ